MEAWRKRHPHGKSGMHFVALKADDESPADASSFLQREAPAGGTTISLCIINSMSVGSKRDEKQKNDTASR